MGTNNPANDPTPDWRELRRQERAQRHSERHTFRQDRAWITGALMILLGVLLMAQNLGVISLHNWWALFILIPAIGSLATAWNIYTQSAGEYTPALVAPLVGGLVLLAVTAAFLFDLDWGVVGPVLLILAGTGALLTSLVWRR